MKSTQAQVVAQCKAVAHMARALADVSEQIAAVVVPLDILQQVGERTARQMELLGNELNNMDAVDDEHDEWMKPVFEQAHLMFPQKKP